MPLMYLAGAAIITLDDWRRAAALIAEGMLFNHPVLIVLSDYSVPYKATEMY